ncbi:MAG: glycosyltransferase [Armatimonadetes bacterium]|nr:glycosyltransferase [Armatimonadota bacterium]
MAVTPSEAVDPLQFFREHPEECAYRTLTPPQRIAGMLGLVALAVLLWRWPAATLLGLNGAAIVFYVAHSLYKLWLIWISMSRPVALQFTPEEVAKLPDAQLPTYTILVPLYREALVLPRLVEHLSKLDYPPDKLDIQLLMEEDDHTTQEACAALRLPPQFRAVVVPDSQPKTKPKACNHGLYTSRSDLLVIYDAEDRPEPDQLRKAVAAFAALPPQVACLQAKLNFYNQRRNLLTRWFTSEYSAWFDLFLPGLTACGWPIPLGGTSNHFRVPVLQELGGWDPFNVTEDCDLGIRLHKKGYLATMIDSTTWEEANGNFLSWFRQRSRWVKGYIQTWLVHMRQPLALMRQLGTGAFSSFHMTIGGAVVSFLLNPVYWLMTLLWFLTRSGLIASLFPAPIYALGVFCLLVANFVFVYVAVIGCLNRGYYDLVKYAVLTPLYWLMMSWGAYKALAQLITRPHYWEKTDHGMLGGAS